MSLGKRQTPVLGAPAPTLNLRVMRMLRENADHCIVARQPQVSQWNTRDEVDSKARAAMNPKRSFSTHSPARRRLS